MLKIRPGQMAAFEEPVLRAYIDGVVAHLARSLPQHFAAVGEAGAREAVVQGIARAETHGLVGKLDICRFIDMMFVLGPDFDTSGTYPWATAILADRDEPDPHKRMDRLCDTALRRLKGGA